jgi:hypothetical protein
VGKRIAIISVTLLLIALAVLGYYIQQGRKRILADPFKAISPGTCIVIETVDLQNFMNSLTTGKGIFGEMARIKEFGNFTSRVKFIADQLNKPGYTDILEGSTSLLSFYPMLNGKLNTQLALNVPSNIRYRHIRELLRSSGINEILDGRSGKNSYLIVPYSVNEVKDTLFISINNGLMICNSSRSGLEESAVQLNRSEDIRSLPGFARIHMTSGKKEDKVFVVFPNLPQLLRQYLKQGREDLADQIGNLAGTGGSDIYISENGIVLSGYTECTDSSEYLNRYKFITPEEFHTYRILPAATILFESMIMQERTITSGQIMPASEKTKVLAGKLGEFTGNEITRAIVDIRDQPFSDNSLVVYELTNRVRAEQIFTEALGSDPAIEYFEPDDQVRMPVYRTSFSGLAGMIKPGFDPGFDEKYYAFYDNFLVAGSTYSTVARLLYDNILNKTLANDPGYREFESTLPSRAGYFFYCVPARIITYLAGFINENIAEALISNKGSLNKIQSVGYQLASSNGMLYNSLSVRYKEEAREESPTEWETLLDTLAAIKPFFFTNHTTGAKEIFIQDLNNNIYLINAAGRVLWKVPLNERITGNIYMIDYFRNGKYQLIFSGRNYLHLIDRNGNYVERYPVKLRSPATNSISIFDYDNNQNYRLFVAGEDKLIYSYDKTGSVVKGWKPFRTAGIVRSEISYFKVSGKDYIVAADENSIYFLDRSGKMRLTPGATVIRSKGSSLRLTPGPDPSVVCSSPDGTVQHISFDGTVRKFSLKTFSSGHSFDIFDINGDGFGEYIFIDKGVLYLYGNNKTEIFSRDFGSENLGGPISFIFSGSDRRIGVFDVNKKLIYLINKDGKTSEGFPLRGASMFSIGRLSDKSGWNLIVGGTDRFLYNYKIETGAK